MSDFLGFFGTIFGTPVFFLMVMEMESPRRQIKYSSRQIQTLMSVAAGEEEV